MDEKRRDELIREYRDLPRGKASDLDKYKESRAAVTYAETPQKRRLNKRILFGGIAAVVVVALIAPLVYFLLQPKGDVEVARNDAYENSMSPVPNKGASIEKDTVQFDEEESFAPVYRSEEEVTAVACDANAFKGEAKELLLGEIGRAHV